MAEINDTPSKDGLLKDLEEIRESLDDDMDDGIPMLTDTVCELPRAASQESAAGQESVTSQEHAEAEAPVEDEPTAVAELPVAFDEKHIFDDLDTSETEAADEALLRAAYRETYTAPDVLEGQQSLFDEGEEFDDADLFDEESLSLTGTRQVVRNSEAAPRDELPAADGENPFLPKHIRERLNRGKNSFLEEMAQVSESLKRNPLGGDLSPPTEDVTDTAEQVVGSGIDHQHIIDELVAEYLPRIEEELRTRLARELKTEQD